MITAASLWVWCTLAAAGAQTLRNAMQRRLVDTVGTVGATHVRFLYALPFVLLFMVPVWWRGAIVDPDLSWPFWGWLAAGALAQVIATGMMLTLMQRSSFVVSTAYIKTEPVQIAVFGFAFLGDRLGVPALAGIVLATLGVVLLSWQSRPAGAAGREPMLRAALLGIATGAMFAISVVGYRGAVLALGDGPFLGRATLALVLALALQSILLSAWLRLREPGCLTALARAWRSSILAGFLGAVASQGWFLAFSLQTAAAVRTVGLVEVLFALALSRRMFAQRVSRRELGALAMIVGGVALLLAAGP